MKLKHYLMIGGFVCLGLVGCQSVSEESAATPGVSGATLSKIAAQGFNNEGVRAVEGGYLVEGDIFLSHADLDRADLATAAVRVGQVEQYRTTNLVRNLPRVITVATSNVPTVYGTALDEAIRRYNALNLQITFQRVTSGAAITVVGFYEGPSGGYITLGSAGFPTSSGNPFNQIRMNTHPDAYGSNPDVNYLASVLQHEIGHCIGFRHTDYMNRAYSCGGRKYNERAGADGAVHIPGTPTGPDPNSWMLACSNGGNRTFNANDAIALNYLY